jgi:hypothetical protein
METVMSCIHVGIKQWKRPSRYTPILAGLQFIRLVMPERALPQGTRDDRFPNVFRADPLTMFKRVRDNWLVDGEPSPFNYIHKFLNYRMNAAKDAGGRCNGLQLDVRCTLAEGHWKRETRWRWFKYIQ